MSTKVGIIRCQKTEANCCGSHCFSAAVNKSGVFQEIELPEIIGFVSCGGCSGGNAILRAKNIVEKGVEILLLTTCITKGSPFKGACPHSEKILKFITEKFGNTIQIKDYTH